jgi:hypothetical protein
MSWSDEELSALRARADAARDAGGWISATEARIVLSLIRVFRKAMMRPGWNGAPEGRLPTIGASKAHGIPGFLISCDRTGCGGQRRFCFDDFALPDTTVFVEIPARLRFRCLRCGGRKVSIMALWPDPLEEKVRRDRAADSHAGS